jgi:hypothetical protein
MMTVDTLAKASRLADEIRCVMRLVAAYPSAAHPEMRCSFFTPTSGMAALSVP